MLNCDFYVFNFGFGGNQFHLGFKVVQVIPNLIGGDARGRIAGEQDLLCFRAEPIFTQPDTLPWPKR